MHISCSQRRCPKATCGNVFSGRLHQYVLENMALHAIKTLIFDILHIHGWHSVTLIMCHHLPNQLCILCNFIEKQV